MSAFNNYRSVNELYDKKIHLCNMLIYIDDVDKDVAPMRVLPGSHLKFKEYSDLVSNSLNIKPKDPNIPQSSVVFDEVIPEDNYHFTVGKRGSVLINNPFLIHGATENFSRLRSRRMLLVTYGPKKEGLTKIGGTNYKNFSLL